LNAVYTQRFNHGHGWVGHVFQGRYQAILEDAFASDLHAKVRPDIPLREIPAVRRRPPSPLSQFAQARQRDAAIHRAYPAAATASSKAAAISACMIRGSVEFFKSNEWQKTRPDPP
jgi:hypothetical protein